MLVPRSGPHGLGPGTSGTPTCPGSPRLPLEPAFLLGFASAVVATALWWLLGAGTMPSLGPAAVAVDAGIVGAFSSVPGAAAVAVICWVFYAGFVRDRFGVLVVDRVAARDLALIAEVATVASIVVTALQASASKRVPPRPRRTGPGRSGRA
ncbi:MAG: hypothetical protein QOG20_898 [Pseudonocardiales bacterium]|jgi:hypothetical protein|nr:hypothetical protein [Pseudonocardiales bacterium]